MTDFDIVKWMKGRVGYDVPVTTLETIALERGLLDVSDFAELTDMDKDLVLADILFFLYTSPTQTASESKSHGDYTYSKGSQTLTDKRHIYDMMMSLYKKWGDPKAVLIEDSDGGCFWMD